MPPKKQGKKHYASLKIFGVMIYWDFDFFLWQCVWLFVKVGYGNLLLTNLHKKLHLKHVFDGHITYTITSQPMFVISKRAQ